MGKVAVKVKIKVWNPKEPVEKTVSSFFDIFKKSNPRMKLIGDNTSGQVKIDAVTATIEGTYTVEGLYLSVVLKVPFVVPKSDAEIKASLEQKFRDYICTVV